MLSVLQRYIPFVGAGRASGAPEVGQPASEGPALTQADEEAPASAPVSHRSAPGEEAGRSRSQSRSRNRKRRLSENSRRFFTGVMSSLNLRFRNEFVVAEDISNGRERYKVPAVSYKRADHPPDDYQYVTEQVQVDPVPINLSLGIMTSCDCLGDCSAGEGCHCQWEARARRYYDSRGRLSARYNLEAPEAIFECNAGCLCNRKRCRNTVLQNGPKVRLVLFRTRSRGWGVRSGEHLKRGTFVGLYAGELLSGSDSTKRQDDTYLFNLSASERPSQPAAADSMEPEPEPAQPEAAAQPEAGQPSREQQFVCDAKFYGNVTRFINHSCEPNLVGIRTFAGHQDSRFPHIAFFAKRDIAPLTELTINYGDHYWIVKCQRDKIYCLCRRPTCRFSKRSFPETLRLHRAGSGRSSEAAPTSGS